MPPFEKRWHQNNKPRENILQVSFIQEASLKTPRPHYNEGSVNSKLGHILEFTHLLRIFSKACYTQY